MQRLDAYFQDEVETGSGHPLIRYLDELATRADFKEAKVAVVRPRAPLGYQPARLYLHFYSPTGTELDRPHAEEWDEALNAALLKRRIRAIDAENENTRFALGLDDALDGAESRFGDGYYNGVLIHHVLNGPFKEHPAVAEVLKHVYRNSIDPSFRSYAECRDMIEAALRGRWKELRSLGYEVGEAGEILATALARYLDDRFSVTNRRILGLL